MRTHRPLLARAALAATVFLALAGSVEALYQTVELHRDSRAATPAVGARRTGSQDQRLRPLREHLPPRGVVGYASDGWSGNAFTTVEALQDYFLTQYALAPVIVLRGADFPIVVGNYPADSAAEQAAGRTYPAGLVVRRNLGEGVLLLEGAQR
ncbi:MAG: hypothetical protein GTO46_02055 [Gemmatimonadetes bacterium]|nr:hypothetical protein [Gemmatimonadota bacterium]NIO30581.1 hypothetical protein [Gemmatimonadota bacterium]